MYEWECKNPSAKSNFTKENEGILLELTWYTQILKKKKEEEKKKECLREYKMLKS